MRNRSHSDAECQESPYRIGGFTAACVLVSNVIGSGIFTTTGFMARDLGDAGLILSLWIVGAILALAAAISYSELGAALPRVGGEYVYITEAYGPLLGFLSGWASFTVGFAAAIAAGAVSFASYLSQVLPVGNKGNLTEIPLALALVWGLTGFHVVSLATGAWLQRFLTVMKVGTILGLVVGAFAFGHGNWEYLSVRQAVATPSFGTMVVSLIFVMYAYSGWNAAGYIAGEIAEPGRNIPRAMIAGTLFVGIIYLLLNLVYVYALPVTTLAQSPVLPVAEKASMAMFGPQGARLITVMLCISISAAVSAMIWAGPRVYYTMAKDRRFPAVFTHTWGETGIPRTSILLQSLWATMLILSGTFEQLVIYSGLVLTVFSALAVGGVVVLRRRRPDLARPFQVPLYPLLPVLYGTVAVLIIVYSALERPTESGWALATVLAGLPVYFFYRHQLHAHQPHRTD